ncbi:MULTISPECIES: streptophobe family protein [unclassified Streptomyces]|uniref:streptophobe family protein n=1 Tax=unclassified Streptomyces TaxID=2593676 RepID=UPI002DD7CC2A|nr:streptophobe family protein [Streptomyces sp. NBC_01750]WSB04533.1 streptophobe family protein [Streptomyces sp. NBC_01794]WSD31185.1 streptophobe family protein [Streptomyces sp. NBC_01750]
MSQQLSSERAGRRRASHGWRDALAAVLAGLALMIVTASLGLWAAGAAELPGNAFPRVVAAVVVMAVGGSVDLSGDAGLIAETQAGLTVMPLSVTLAGALVIAGGFLRPLRNRAVASTRELTGWAARMAAVWALALIALAALARHSFAVRPGDRTIADIGDLLDASPEVGFRADIALTLVFGLLWLAALLVLALLVSRKAPLPARLVRFQESVRPAAFAMVALLMAYVVLGLVIGLVVLVTRGHPAETCAVLLLGLPNLAWLALTLGLGASWEGKVQGPFGLPVPHVMDSVLRTSDGSTLNLSSLTQYDGRAWWLLVVAALLLPAAAFLMAARSPARTRPWQHAVHMAVALALTVLTICLVARLSAHYGLSLLGLGDIGGGLAGEVFLRPMLFTSLGLAVVWGLAAGFVGSLLAARVRRRGEVEPAAN